MFRLVSSRRLLCDRVKTDIGGMGVLTTPFEVGAPEPDAHRAQGPSWFVK